METITINKAELKAAFKESLNGYFTENKQILEDAFLEVLEDIGLAHAMDNAESDPPVGKKEIFSILGDKWIFKNNP